MSGTGPPYVLEQGEIRLVLTSGVRADSDVSRFAAKHGDAAKDVALQVPDAAHAYREAVQRGARGIAEPHWVEDEHGRVQLATIGTYGEAVHTFVNRAEYNGPYLPGYVSLSPNGHRRQGAGLIAVDHVVGNVELGQMNRWVEFYESVFGMTNIVHFGDDQIQTEYSALMSKVMADGSARSSSRSTSRPRGSGRARSTSTSSSTRAPACSTSPSSRRASSRRSRR